MFTEIAENIRAHYKNEYEHVPKKENLIEWVDQVLDVLLPIQQPNSNETIQQLKQSRADFKNLLMNSQMNKEEADEMADRFYSKLSEIHLNLLLDAEELLNNDPAAECMGEVVHTYPGFYAICIYRIAHCIHTELKIQYIPRMLTEYAHSKTGIDIHPGAEIGVPFLIDHGTGVVIGETCQIGKHVNIYQGVTLGAMQVEKNMKNKKRHPTIEDGVVIYANATILGGDTVIGNHSVIGGNVFLTTSVEPHSLVFSKIETQVKKIKSTKQAINFVI
jgi:serine O-acetyltransferase